MSSSTQPSDSVATKQLLPFVNSKFGAYNFTKRGGSKSDSKLITTSAAPFSAGYIRSKSVRKEQNRTGFANGESGTRQALSDITNAKDKKQEARDLSAKIVDSPTPVSKRKSTQSLDPPQKRILKSSANNKGPIATSFVKCAVKSLALQPAKAEELAVAPVRTPRFRSQTRRMIDESIRAPPGSQSPPSKLLSLRKKLLDKVAGKSIVKQKQRRKVKDVRRLSLVLKNEKDLLETNKAMEEKLQSLQEQCCRKESEIESVRNVGKMLGRLCMNQADELKAIKGAFPSTLREVTHLRQVCQKQEKELRYARTVVPSLQEQVKVLTAQLDTLATDIEKVKAERMARRTFSCDISNTLPASQKGSIHLPDTSPSTVPLDSTCTFGKGDEARRPLGCHDSSAEAEKADVSDHFTAGAKAPIREELNSVNHLLTETNLEAIMQKLNLSAEKDLSTLEESCVKAFENLGFSS